MRHPSRVIADRPAEGAATRVADGQGLRRRIAASLLGRKGETGWAHSNGGWYRRGGDGQGHGDGDGRSAGRAEGNGPAIAAGGQCAGRHTGGHCAIAGA